ncbi:MAG: hypothetical protein A2054_05520 [Deltaproteobacteria bacterium GWA2_55_10]|nr:MAG: hypothetical protein A2054_05520 [Deltaproteobacteria bacterium GWA2_55_10]
MRSIGIFRTEGRRAKDSGLFDALLLSLLPAAAIGADRTITEASAGLCSLTCYSGRELRGMSLEKLLDRGIPAAHAFEARLFTKDARAVRVRATMLRSGAAAVIVLQSLENEERLSSELKSSNGRLEERERYLADFREGVFRMLTDLDRSESELKGALVKLGETQMQLIQSSKMTALGELAASLAHEVSQPLTVVMGLSQGALRTIEEGTQEHRKMHLISEAAKKMEAVVKHLRVFARVEPPELKAIDLNQVVRDAFLILGEMLHSNSIEIIMEPGQVPRVLGNPNRLEQVIINLVTNARDAMPEGGALTVRTGTIEIKGSRFAELTIRDTGTGIPEGILDRIFDPFVTTKEAGKGTGLGLSITSGIIKEHRGEIRVSTDEGGTAFHIIIPAEERG